MRGQAFSLFAYERGNDHVEPLRRDRLPEPLIPLALKWALEQGCDTILVERYRAEPFHPEVVHHLCTDPGCPGGC